MKTKVFFAGMLAATISVTAFAGDASTRYRCNVYSSNTTQERKEPVIVAVLNVDATHPTDSATISGFEVDFKFEGNDFPDGHTMAVYSISKHGVKTEGGVGPDTQILTAYEGKNKIDLMCFPRTYGR